MVRGRLKHAIHHLRTDGYDHHVTLLMDEVKDCQRCGCTPCRSGYVGSIKICLLVTMLIRANISWLVRVYIGYKIRCFLRLWSGICGLVFFVLMHEDEKSGSMIQRLGDVWSFL